MLFAQITDCHIGFDPDNSHELNVRRLNLVIDQLNAQRPRPDFLLVTGDLVEHGDDSEAYAHLKALVGRFEGEALFLIGNHDNRAKARAAFPSLGDDGAGFCQQDVRRGGLRLLLLDTMADGRHGGAYCEERSRWLEARLAEAPDEPTVVVLHHPPIDTLIPWMSALPGEEWVERLRSILTPAAQVKAILAGHVHRALAASFAGKPLMVCPSTAPGIALDLDDVDPLYPDGRALIIGDPPGYALHQWDGERLLSHFETAGPRHVLATYDSNLQPMMKAFLEERGTG